ncbi:MAG: hypothetical protein KDA22_15080, partial [Phycisphaerales bacterium]|nr:hypothetical protein [Phycisphaerales bacterium]
QGPIGWTPLQAANAYATMARSGAIRDATVIMNDDRSSLRERSGDMNLDPQAVTLALEGLRDSIEKPYGTGNHITYEDGHTEPIVTAQGVIAWAKTGTAQAPGKRFDTNGDGMPDTDVNGLDHAWFVGLVGSAAERRPRYAIAVVLEYGGSGGRVAGPVANQIILALQDLGYLPRPDAAPSGGKGAAR